MVPKLYVHLKIFVKSCSCSLFLPRRYLPTHTITDHYSLLTISPLILHVSLYHNIYRPHNTTKVRAHVTMKGQPPCEDIIFTFIDHVFTYVSRPYQTNTSFFKHGLLNNIYQNQCFVYVHKL